MSIFTREEIDEAEKIIVSKLQETPGDSYSLLFLIRERLGLIGKDAHELIRLLSKRGSIARRLGEDNVPEFYAKKTEVVAQ